MSFQGSCNLYLPSADDIEAKHQPLSTDINSPRRLLNNSDWLGRKTAVIGDTVRRFFNTVTKPLRALGDYLIDIIRTSCQSIGRHYHFTRDNESVSLNYNPTFTQKGSTCKLAALAMVNEYYAQNGQVSFFPLNKKNKKLKVPSGEILSYDGKQRKIEGKSSFREIAKSCGSVQGEITSPAILEKVAHRAGLDCEKSVIENFDDYKNAIISYIRAGKPVVIFLHVNGASFNPKYPNPDQWAEHAVVVTGFNSANETFQVASHGRIHDWSINDIWNATSLIKTKRMPEIYARKSDKNQVTFRYMGADISQSLSLPSKWTDIHQLYASTGVRLAIAGKIYTSINEVEALPPSTELRKSIQSQSKNDHFRRTLMVFTPAPVTSDKTHIEF